MRALIRIVLGLTLTLGLVASASAQDTRRSAEPDLAPDISYDFGDDFVTGGVDSPLGEWLNVPRGRGRISLIRPRVHFVPEMLKSVERI